jgi:hypothetical protein
MAGHRRNLIAGAVVGAVLVALIAGALGEALRDLASPGIMVGFIALGAVLGAYAWGIVAYQREHEDLEPTAAYRAGILAELDPEPEPDTTAPPREPVG